MLYWIWLTELENIGPITQRRLLKRFESPIGIYNAASRDLIKIDGIGKKTALRLVLNLLKRDGEELKLFAEALGGINDKISACKTCGNITDGEDCGICSQNSRRRNTI